MPRLPVTFLNSTTRPVSYHTHTHAEWVGFLPCENKPILYHWNLNNRTKLNKNQGTDPNNPHICLGRAPSGISSTSWNGEGVTWRSLAAAGITQKGCTTGTSTATLCLLHAMSTCTQFGPRDGKKKVFFFFLYIVIAWRGDFHISWGHLQDHKHAVVKDAVEWGRTPVEEPRA